MSRWQVTIHDVKSGTPILVLSERVDRVTAVSVAKAVGDDEVADDILGDQQSDESNEEE